MDGIEELLDAASDEDEIHLAPDGTRPEEKTTINEQIFPNKACCPFIQFISSKQSQWSSGSLSRFRTTGPCSIPGLDRSTQPFIPTAVGR
ncbi:hypothetical protein TNCV_2033451 [Trichonephila clavipes]|nr:hypothetical protein TNCV_2033451 [Trichonephila clavipes]